MPYKRYGFPAARPDFGPEADRESLDGDSRPLGRGQMTGLMNQDQQAQQQDDSR
jgi:hypothetical protein